MFGTGMLLLLSTFGGRDPRDPLAIGLLYILPSIVCFSFKRRPIRFALGLGALMLGSSIYVSAHEQVPYRGRSFFGVYRVVDDATARLRVLIHGRTVHGAQSLDPARTHEPLTYFHRTGPIGQALAAFHDEAPRTRVAVIGLGIGSLSAYGERGQRWTFYEIDPEIAQLARDPRYFTFMHDSPADVRVVLGDARMSLAKEPAFSFDLLVVDAFSSDAIPVHLITRQAFKLYDRVLDSHGVLAFHLSNRYIDLKPVLADLARDADLVCLSQEDMKVPAEDLRAGKLPSHWMLMARSIDDFRRLGRDPRWQRVGPRPAPVVWTDDFSNPLAVMHWLR